MSEPKNLILGHRGLGATMKNDAAAEAARRAAGRAVENTLRAVKQALDGGADGFEIDIVLSKDGVPMVIHDEELNLHLQGADRKARDRGRVKDLTREQLQALPLADGNHPLDRIPTLAEVLALTARYSPPRLINIELKGEGAAAKTVALVSATLAQGTLTAEQFVFSSFDHSQLETVRQLAPDLRIGLLFTTGYDKPIYAADGPRYVPYTRDTAARLIAHFRPYSLHPVYTLVDAEMVALADEAGVLIIAWTSGEAPPHQNREKLDAFFGHQGALPLHLITDYPVQLKALR